MDPVREAVLSRSLFEERSVSEGGDTGSREVYLFFARAEADPSLRHCRVKKMLEETSSPRRAATGPLLPDASQVCMAPSPHQGEENSPA